MYVAGILLTGGSSRRMGLDKGALRVAPVGSQGSERRPTLAVRTAGVLAQVVPTLLEVGSGSSGLPHISDSVPGGGPLRGLVDGWHCLRRDGFLGSTLALSTDLPLLSVEAVRWLASYPGERSVVPLVEGVPQTLCARYCADDLDEAARMVAGGGSSLRALLATIDPVMADPRREPWFEVQPQCFSDVDHPDDLARVGLSVWGGDA